MATRWRIRHKLLLGLGLVMLVMTGLLLGTLRGLWQYHLTTVRTRIQLDELLAAEALKKAVGDLIAPEDAEGLIASETRLNAELGKVHEAVKAYEEIGQRVAQIGARDILSYYGIDDPSEIDFDSLWSSRRDALTSRSRLRRLRNLARHALTVMV